MLKFLPAVSIALLLGSATVSAQGTPSAVDNDVTANDSAIGSSMDEDQRALADGNDDSGMSGWLGLLGLAGLFGLKRRDNDREGTMTRRDATVR